MNKKINNYSNFLLSLILTFLIIISNIPTSVKADIEPEISEAGGLQVNGNINTYLKIVNVSIELYDYIAKCEAIYVLENPSEVNETFNVLFDPSQKPINASVIVDNLNINYTEKNVEEFYHSYERRDVITFPINIQSNSTLLIKIYWEMTIKREWSHLIFVGIPIGKTDHTSWDISYLIIGTRSWNHNIETVDVIFDIRSDNFNDYKFRFKHGAESRYEKNVKPKTIYKNAYGYDVIHFHFENFTEESILIVMNTNTISKTEYGLLSIGIIIISLIVIIVILIYLIKLKKKH